MAYRHGNREQMELFPPSIEDYVKEDNPVRAYDAFVEALDIDKLGIILDEDKVGNPEYYPRVMLKLLVYGYSYGFRSSRKLERAVHDNFSFVWLTGGLKPDHKTIAEFRRKNKSALKNVLKQCVQLCIRLDLIAGNTLFVDGTKIRANAGIKNAWTKEKCEHYLKHIDEHIETILSEIDSIDEQEEGQGSLIKMRVSLREEEFLRTKVSNILKELGEEDKKAINTTDPECNRINSLQGSHAGYNAQIVVDEKYGLIVHSDVVSKNNDLEQFAGQISQANETIGKKCEVACADSGYANTSELEKIDSQGIKVIVPSQRQASEKEPSQFDKERFQYDSEKDCYICPVGHELRYTRINRRKDKVTKEYKIPKKSICRECRHLGVCTSSRYGRKVSRLINEEVRLKLETQYKESNSQVIYSLRKEKVEHPFGHIKRNLKVDAFLLRGVEGVKAEMSLLATCFNLARITNILGVKGFIQELSILEQGGFFVFIQNRRIQQRKLDKSSYFMPYNICLN